MPNRQLTKDELQLVRAMLDSIRGQISNLASGDPELLFAIRRKIAKELGYDERGKPMERKALKSAKRAVQGGLCAICQEPLPDKYAVLDRLEAMPGYTLENTRLICQECDTKNQAAKGYS